MLERRITEKGIDLEPLKYYVESFKHGISPHAGAGIGLERVVFLYLGSQILREVHISFSLLTRLFYSPYSLHLFSPSLSPFINSLLITLLLSLHTFQVSTTCERLPCFLEILIDATRRPKTLDLDLISCEYEASNRILEV
jgi:tRNA synthetases class II (D, K and N)